jgi:hypothetical protein
MGKVAFHARPALVCLLLASLSPTPAIAQNYDIRYDHYLNASGASGAPYMENGVVHATPSYQRGLVCANPSADNRAEVNYHADLARGTLGAYAYSTGDVVPSWPYVETATGRVNQIQFEIDLYFDVPSGSYPDGVVVSVAGEAVGSLSATTDAGAMVQYSVTFGETFDPPLKQILVEESKTLDFDEPFTLDARILPAGAVLTAPTRCTVRLTASIDNAWTWAVQGGAWPDYTTGSASIAMSSGLRFLQVVVPAGVTWTSPDDVFMSLPAGVGPRAFPPRLALGPNVPNPFTASTAMRFELPRAGAARLRIHDLAGRVVRTLVDGERAAGSHHVPWDGRDDAGRALASGVYIGRLEAGGVTRTSKLLLAR